MHRDGPKLENFPCEEWRNQENHFTPVKLESKKQAKKVVAEREGLRWEVPIECLRSSNVPPNSRWTWLDPRVGWELPA